MRFDFSGLPLRNRAFSDKPMTFCDAEPNGVLTSIIELIAIETGKRIARENWPKGQLTNLLKHAHERSPFWRKRIGTKKVRQMRFDFSQLPLRNRAFSVKPMTFCDAEPKGALSSIIDLIAIETGKRYARENWQKEQLTNLLKHAYERSPFWRKRIGTKKISAVELSDLPILTRSDVVQQVKSEGSLLAPRDGMRVFPHSTSGSSGVPVQFFISEMNRYYNQIRSLAQYFIEGRDLSLNRTQLRTTTDEEAKGSHEIAKNGFRVEETEKWLGHLSALLHGGINRLIHCWHPNRSLLLKELSEARIGYLVGPPRIIEMLFGDGDVELLKKYDTEMYIPIGEEMDANLRDSFRVQNISTRGNYSSEEVGLIGCECDHCPEHYTITTSNVIVELDTNSVVVEGKQLAPIIVTHLHSYATPFIRYDVGDLGTLDDRCGCGRDGPVLSNVVGRNKTLLKQPDGRLTSFHIRGKEITHLAECTEFRVRQTDVNTIVLELGGCEHLNSEKRKAFAELIKSHSGGDFAVDVRPVKEIDWGQSAKHLAFRNEIL